MFRFRNRVGLELALETLHAYATRERDFGSLLYQPKQLHVDNVLAPYL